MVILKGIYTIYAWATWILMGFWAFLWAFLISIIRGKKGLSQIIMGYKIFAWCWFFVVGIRIKLKGKEIRDTTQACIIVSNHGSNIDMMTAPYVLRTKVSPLAKEELKKIPMLGYMFRAVSVFVNRKDPESRRRSLADMKKKLNDGIFIFMFPEGTRNRTLNPLKDFYDGAFKIAIEIQKPIMPLIFLNLRKVAPLDSFFMQPGTVTGEFMQPIPTEGLTDADVPMLKEKVYKLMYDYIETNDPYYKKKNK
jgi:1-acyl-sn-glycerol-3-phosphate acyltransferase